MGCTSDNSTELRGNYNRSLIMEENNPISSGAKIDLEKFRKSALQKHNELRKKHGAPDLTLNEELNQMVQD